MIGLGKLGIGLAVAAVAVIGAVFGIRDWDSDAPMTKESSGAVVLDNIYAVEDGISDAGSREVGAAGIDLMRPFANQADTSISTSRRERGGNLVPRGPVEQVKQRKLSSRVQLPYLAICLAGYGIPLAEGVKQAEGVAVFERTDNERKLADTVAEDLGGKVRHQVGALAGWWLLEFPSVDAANAGHSLMAGDTRVVEALIQYQSVRPKRTNDPLFTSQWHLKNTGQSGRTPGLDLNVEPAWTAGHTGQGVRIGIVDDGVEFTHPDLTNAQYVAGSYDFEFNTTNGSPKDTYDDHGTAVAGLAGARANNAIGVASPAHGSQLASLRLLAFNMTDAMEAAALGHMFNDISIYNNSWGPPDWGDYEHPGPLMAATLANGVNVGRGGRGSIYVWAGGNGYDDDDANYDGYANLPETISVAAVNGNGIHADYSEPGACHLLAGLAGGLDVVTTDRMGTNGYNTSAGSGNLADLNYTNDFDGTSATTPMVSGVIAQMLQANPTLTWRDVQHILIRSARKFNNSHSSWRNNGAGYRVSHRWGFGLPDAQAACTLATSWTNVPTRQTVSSPSYVVNQSIPESGPALSFTHSVVAPFHCEHVQVRVDINHTYWGDLVLTLTSPSGITSTLATEHYGTRGTNFTGNVWTYMSVQHWGEQAQGTWTLTVRDGLPADTGVINNWTLILHGTTGQPGPNGGAGSPVLTTQQIPDGTVGQAYSHQLSATGGLGGQYQWGITLGALPPGLTLNPATGLVSGTPGAQGTYSFTVSVTDSQGTGTRQYFMFVYGGGLAIISPSGPAMVQGGIGKPYHMTLMSAGGTGTTRMWSISPPLPLGLSLTQMTGVISGTPLVAGFTSHTITVSDGTIPVVSKIAFLTIHSPLAFTNPSGFWLPAAPVGKPYVFTFGTSGGSGSPKTYSVAPILPQGLLLGANTGAITGTPQVEGVYSFDVMVSDQIVGITTKSLHIEVTGPIVIATEHLPLAEVNVPYSAQLSATGGVGTSLSYTVSPTLPAGFALNQSTGVISGTATSPFSGTYTFTVTDGTSNPAHRPLTLTILPPSPRFKPNSIGATGTFGGGMQVSVARSISNIGQLAGTCTYSVYLSSDYAVDSSDILLATRTVVIPAGGTSSLTETMRAPVGIPTGDYYIGIVLTANGVDPSADRVASWTPTVKLAGAVQHVTVGDVTIGRAAQSTVMVPVFVRNIFHPQAHSISMNIGLPGTVLVYDNNVVAGPAANGMNFGGILQGNGSVTLIGNGANPVHSGIVAFVRFRVPSSVGAFATAANVAATVTSASLLSGQSDSLETTATGGRITIADHGFQLAPIEGASTPNAEFEVLISLANTAAAGVGRAELMLELSTQGIEYVSTIAGAAALGAGKVVTGTPTPNGIVISISQNVLQAMPSGEVAKVRFRVMPSGAVIGVSEARLSVVSAMDTTPGQQNSLVVGSDFELVRLSPISFKDVNVDGFVDVVDVQSVVNLILGTMLAQFQSQGDSNNDQVVDVVDVQTIVNCILGQGSCD